jgi:hypothetical protein
MNCKQLTAWLCLDGLVENLWTKLKIFSNIVTSGLHWWVAESKAEIVGGVEKMVQAGSSLRLICLLRHSMEPPAYIFWYHDSRMINYDTARGVEVRVHSTYKGTGILVNKMNSEIFMMVRYWTQSP